MNGEIAAGENYAHHEITGKGTAVEQLLERNVTAIVKKSW